MIDHLIYNRLMLHAGLSSVLYHATSLRNATNIVAKNRFELVAAEGNPSELKLLGGVYYMSMSRVPTGGYIVRNTGRNSAIIQIDGRKLGTKYKGAPVDYWAGKSEYQEAEDRVISNRPFINNATSYITAIHAIGDAPQFKAHLFELYRQCKLKKVPLFLYEDNPRALITLNPKYRINTVPTREVQDRYPDPQHRYKAESRLRGFLNLWEMPYTKNTSRWTKGLKYAYDLLPYQDAVFGFEADMHNGKHAKYGAITRDRETVDAIVKILRKEKIDTKEFIKRLVDKWYYPK